MAIRQVAIIGAGPLGRKLAHLSARSGYRTILEDVLPSNLRTAQEQMVEPEARLRYAGTIEEAVREADVVMDTVPDELESKLELFSLIDRMAPPATIIATPSRALSIADLASCTYRPGRCVAVELPEMAGLSPDAGKALPLVVTTETEATVIAELTEFFERLGFQPEVRLDRWQPV